MGLFKKDARPKSHFTTPRFPIHPLLDVLTGDIIKCIKGDYVINGGLAPHIAVNGKGNSNKTLILLSILLTFILRHLDCKYDVDSQVYETENTLEYMRVLQIARGLALRFGYSHDEIDEVLQKIDDKFVLRNSANLDGTVFYDEFNDLSRERIKSKKYPITLPFTDFRGEEIKIHEPHVCGIDSFSAMSFGVVDEKYIDKNTAGSSDNNVMYLRDAGAKTQLLQNWVNQNPASNSYVISTAHMGDNISMDMSTPEKKMMFMKQNHKLKNVPEKYYFYVSVMFFVNGSVPLLNQDKVPLYPTDTTDKAKSDNKDILLELVILRNKHGQSGAFIPLIASQNTGIDWQLSAFHYCKVNGFWGISGNQVNYEMDLLPGVALSRSVIRRKLADIPALRRVVDITCELGLLYRYSFDKIPNHLKCSPKELYDGLKEQGYNVEELWETTRGYYTVDHYDHPIPPLSTYDLLRMRAGEYIPYWMKEDQIPEGAKKLHAKFLAGNAELVDKVEEVA